MSNRQRLWSPEVRDLGSRLVTLNGRQADELIDYLRDEYGIKAPEFVSPVVIREEEPTCVIADLRFQVVLEGIIDPAARVSVMKALRQVKSIGLQEARQLLDSLPQTIAENLERIEAERLSKTLQDAGGRMLIR